MKRWRVVAMVSGLAMCSVADGGQEIRVVTSWSGLQYQKE
jgi:hypothetical protein